MRTLVLGLLVLAACGKTPASYRDFVHQSDQITCEALVRCCAAPGTAADCTASVDGAIDGSTTQIEAQIASGALSFHADVASLCLDALRGGYASCDASSASLGANGRVCTGVITAGGDAGAGQTAPTDQPEGAPCQASLECASAICQQGTCQPASTVRAALCTGATG